MSHSDALLSLSQLPARRNLQELRDALAAATPGDALRAAFKTERYGVFAVDGVARRAIGGDLGIGGHLLGADTRVDSDLVRILPLATDVELPDITDGVLPSALEHGDIVRAYIRHDVHGLIALIGPVTESDHDRFRLVGSWIITDDDRFAPRVVAVERVATRDENVLTVPPRRRHVDAVVPA